MTEELQFMKKKIEYVINRNIKHFNINTEPLDTQYETAQANWEEEQLKQTWRKKKRLQLRLLAKRDTVMTLLGGGEGKNTSKKLRQLLYYLPLFLFLDFLISVFLCYFGSLDLILVLFACVSLGPTPKGEQT